MSQVDGTGWCRNCNEQRLTHRKGTNHVLHLILTVLTVGLWGIVWIIVAISNRSNLARCSVCGAPTQAMSAHLGEEARKRQNPLEAGSVDPA